MDLETLYNELLYKIDSIEYETGLKPKEIRYNEKFERIIIEDYYKKLPIGIQLSYGYSTIFGIKCKKNDTVPDNTIRLIYEDYFYKRNNIFTTEIIEFVDVYEVE